VLEAAEEGRDWEDLHFGIEDQVFEQEQERAKNGRDCRSAVVLEINTLVQ
jgi:pimeloyl-CoA synthetase